MARSVEVATRAELARCPHWAQPFPSQRKDHRYYELVEDTIHQGFDYRYFVIKDAAGEVCAVQPFFMLDQDLLAGIAGPVTAAAEFVRRWWPGFMQMRTLMVGCAAGEGHFDRIDELSRRRDAQLLADAIKKHARDLKARLIVLKEFPADVPDVAGMLRATRLHARAKPADGQSQYRLRGLRRLHEARSARRMRSDLRRKFRDAAQAAPIEMSVVTDMTPIIDDIYPLYLQVYERSPLHFEKLTKEYLCSIGRLMPDKVRFFVWRQAGKIIGFSMCMVQGDAIYSEYLGLDYPVALGSPSLFLRLPRHRRPGPSRTATSVTSAPG